MTTTTPGEVITMDGWLHSVTWAGVYCRPERPKASIGPTRRASERHASIPSEGHGPMFEHRCSLHSHLTAPAVTEVVTFLAVRAV